MSDPEGITNHPASTEAAEDAKLKDQPTPPDPTARDPLDKAKHLPTGMAEKVETVEISTFKPKKS